jgi:2-polyprenyl-3-methyl-5-hydroxy-6-metoxy-1,4-benzoquinol methylase
VRYQYKPDPWSSHSLIAAWLRVLPPGSRVLDIGAAQGTLGMLLQGQDLALRGIEPAEDWADLARPYYADFCTAPLAEVDDAFLRGHAGVVCADVLEHLPDPQVQLDRLAALQPPGARFILSVPNVANLWVRLNLLLGRFDYTERGILDRTHLRFFTRRSLLAMIAAAGLDIERVAVTPLPLNLVHPFFANNRLGRALHAALAFVTRFLPTLLGYQFVTLSTRNTEPGEKHA